jgi:hypothetical protein
LVYPVGGRSGKVIDARQPGPVERPECIQKIAVNIIAPGSIGALTFLPYNSTTPVQLINTAQTTVVTVENTSDAGLFYELWCETHFRAETNGIDVTDIVSDIQVLNDAFPLDRNSHCGLICSSPTGNIPARSQSKVTFTFHPQLAGLFTFKIFAKIKTLDANGQEVMVSNSDIASKMMSMSGSIENLDDLSLMAVIDGSSSFPKIVFEDIRVDSDSVITDTEQLWRQFSLSTLNYDLSVPMNDNESKALLLSTAVDVDLKKYDFVFTPKSQYSPIESITIQVRNHGSLPAAFHFHYPNEQELELEPWVEEESPSDEKLQETTIIDKLKCFAISPLHAVLMPNETCILTMKYSYDSLKYHGKHTLPMKVVIDKGRRFIIELNGHTIPVEKGYNPKRSISSGRNIALDHVLLVPFADLDGTSLLQPVPIGKDTN